MLRNPIIRIVLILTAIVAAAYVGVGLFMHHSLADITHGCSERTRMNRPHLFTDSGNYFENPSLDFSPYWMENYEAVLFPSRDAHLTLSGWYIPAETADAPVIISVHGIGSCKYSTGNLLQAGMLHNAGFAVLVIDVRDAGDSDYEDGLSAIGNEEYRDVLGAFDWLQTEKGHTPQQIGVLGNSLGAATALIAFSEEPELAAAFVDSPFDNLPQIIREELIREGYPEFLYASGLMAARLRGDNINFSNPHNAIDNANGRPIFVTHGTADGRIGVHHAYQLQERAEAQGENVEFWIVEGQDHVKALGQIPDEYEQRLVAFFSEALK